MELLSNVFTAPGEQAATIFGRDRELAFLSECRREAAAGRGQVVAIGGEAGIGKSTLVRRFEASIASGRSFAASASCIEFVQTPLGPLRDLLHKLHRTVPKPRDAAVRSLVDRLTFEREAEGRTAEPAGWLLSSIDAAFERYAQRGTVVLLLEDVHWADSSTLRVLSIIAEHLASRRILVALTYRVDDLAADRHRQSELAKLLARRSVTQLSLAPLEFSAVQACSKRPQRRTKRSTPRRWPTSCGAAAATPSSLRNSSRA